jgi:metallopeptidase MepB
MSTNNISTPPQPLPTFTTTPISVEEHVYRLIKNSREVQDQVVLNVQPESATFANVLLPLAHAENAMILEAHTLIFYKDVSADPDLREASSKAKNLLDDFAVQTGMRDDLFSLVDAVLNKKENLDPESLHYLRKVHKEFIRNGLNLPVGTKRDRFKEIKARLSQLTTEFRKNMANANDGGIWFTPDELKGVPKESLEELEKGKEGGENEGKLQVRFKRSPILRFATSGETRRRYYIANENRCPKNVPIFQEALLLRDEAARVLGYPNHAAFRLEDMMAKSPETVHNFLDDLAVRLGPGGRGEFQALKEFKRVELMSRGEPFDGHYFHWDHAFYGRLMLAQQYSVDHQKISEYFPLQSTVKGFLEIFQQLFGLQFREISGHEQSNTTDSPKVVNITWHEDVQLFSVWDEDQSKGTPLQGFLREDNTRQYPATALTCGFTKPTSKKPSLLKHNEMEALFHELGHGIHDLVAKTKYARFHGFETVVDFGEAPSQMLENWCWLPSVLKKLGRHYSNLSAEYLTSWKEKTGNGPESIQPPKEIPDEMIQNLLHAKHVNKAMYNLMMVSFGVFDMTIHEPESHEAIKSLNAGSTFNSIRSKIWPVEGPEALGQGDEWGHYEATFGHLMGEYHASFYSYLL